MEFLAEIGLFLAKALIIVAAVLAIIGGIARAARSGGDGGRGRLKVVKLNDRYRKLALEMKRAILPKAAAKAAQKSEKARRKAERKEAAEAIASREARARVYFVEFEGNLRATAVEGLRREITAILSVARPGDEVLVRLSSAGGYVHAYGLGASQLERVKARGLRLVVAVDMVAASGGYLMACVADHVIAAPFAIIGSIGVVAGIPNVHRLLKKHDVDFELLTAGEHKRTLTVFGENTEAGRRKLQQELDETHALFKSHVARHRPGLDVGRVATGEHWYGTQALELGLVDAIATSDDYLLTRRDSADLLHVRYVEKKKLGERLGLAAEGAAKGAVDHLLQRDREARHL